MCSIYLSIFLFAVSLRIQEDTLWQICLISNVVFSNAHLHLKIIKSSRSDNDSSCQHGTQFKLTRVHIIIFLDIIVSVVHRIYFNRGNRSSLYVSYVSCCNIIYVIL